MKSNPRRCSPNIPSRRETWKWTQFFINCAFSLQCFFSVPAHSTHVNGEGADNGPRDREKERERLSGGSGCGWPVEWSVPLKYCRRVIVVVVIASAPSRLSSAAGVHQGRAAHGCCSFNNLCALMRRGGVGGWDGGVVKIILNQLRICTKLYLFLIDFFVRCTIYLLLIYQHTHTDR